MSPVKIENIMKTASGNVTNATIGKMKVNPTINPIGG